MTRMIHAGLLEGGMKPFAKTTGTVPAIINKENEEKIIKRRGLNNIKEQIKILKLAYDNGANIVVIECMAIHPNLQNVSNNMILESDFSVITNARLDHLDVMGNSIEEIRNALLNTLSTNGVAFTADEALYKSMLKKDSASEKYLVKVEEDYKFDFNENVALALAVCKRLGINSDVALNGIKKYIRDPYSLRFFTFDSGAKFINALSVNDIDSMILVYDNLKKEFEGKEVNLIINNRGDRQFRTSQLLDFIKYVNPKKTYLMGQNTLYMKRNLDGEVKIIKKIDDFKIDMMNENEIYYATGNLAGIGLQLIEKVEKEGLECKEI